MSTRQLRVGQRLRLSWDDDGVQVQLWAIVMGGRVEDGELPGSRISLALEVIPPGEVQRELEGGAGPAPTLAADDPRNPYRARRFKTDADGIIREVTP